MGKWTMLAAPVVVLLGAIGWTLISQHSRIEALRADQAIIRTKVDTTVGRHTEDVAEIGIKIGLLNGRLDELEDKLKRLTEPKRPAEPKRRTPIRDLFDKRGKKGTQ